MLGGHTAPPPLLAPLLLLSTCYFMGPFYGPHTQTLPLARRRRPETSECLCGNNKWPPTQLNGSPIVLTTQPVPSVLLRGSRRAANQLKRRAGGTKGPLVRAGCDTPAKRAEQRRPGAQARVGEKLQINLS